MQRARDTLGSDVIVALGAIGERQTLADKKAAEVDACGVETNCRRTMPALSRRNTAGNCRVAAQSRRQFLARHFATGAGRARGTCLATIAAWRQAHAEKRQRTPADAEREAFAEPRLAPHDHGRRRAWCRRDAASRHLRPRRLGRMPAAILEGDRRRWRRVVGHSMDGSRAYLHRRQRRSARHHARSVVDQHQRRLSGDAPSRGWRGGRGDSRDRCRRMRQRRCGRRWQELDHGPQRERGAGGNEKRRSHAAESSIASRRLPSSIAPMDAACATPRVPPSFAAGRHVWRNRATVRE